MLHGTLQGFIDGIEYSYCVTNTRRYGENSVRRGGGYLKIVVKANLLINILMIF